MIRNGLSRELLQCVLVYIRTRPEVERMVAWTKNNKEATRGIDA